MDGLDIPLVRMLDASFAERYPESTQPVTRPEGDALARYGANLMPIEYTAPSLNSPLFVYPYAQAARRWKNCTAMGRASRARRQDAIRESGDRRLSDAHDRYVHPVAAEGLQRRGSRATDGTVYCVSEGKGRSTVGDRTFEWGPRDIFVAPSWTTVRHDAASEAVLFSYSDRPVQKALGLWREEVGTGFKPFS